MKTGIQQILKKPQYKGAENYIPDHGNSFNINCASYAGF